MNSERHRKAEKLVAKLVDNATGPGTSTVQSAEEFHAKTNAPPGSGSEFMRKLTGLADAYGSTITLQTASTGDRHGDEYKRTSSSQRIKSFYGRFGFKSNYSARSYRSDLSGNMHGVRLSLQDAQACRTSPERTP